MTRPHRNRRSLLLPSLFIACLGCQGRAECPAQPLAAITTVDRVKEAPLSFLGEEVRVVGEVEKVHGERAFELEGAGWAIDDNITVLTRTPVHVVGGALVPDERVVVTGTVRRFEAGELQRELDWSFPVELQRALEDRPVIVADSVEKISSHGRWTSGVMARPLVTLVGIAAALNLNVLVGQEVEFKAERVQALTGNGLWVGPNVMSQIFVLPAGGPGALRIGDVVDVSGTLRVVPADADALWGLPSPTPFPFRPGVLYVDAATVVLSTGAQAGSQDQ